MHDSGQHAEQIVELDTQKFRIAKAASDLEIESERLESELDMLKERLADLEAQGLEGDEGTRREREADDATMYALWPHSLKVYWLTMTVSVLKYTGRWASISSRTRLETSPRL